MDFLARGKKGKIRKEKSLMKRSVSLFALMLAVFVALGAVRVTAAPPFDYAIPAAMPLKQGANIGTLPPGAERWYIFTRAELDNEAFGGRAFSLIHSSSGEDVADDVNFQVFGGDPRPFLQQRDIGMIVNMGEGGLIPASSDPSTAHLWFGNLVGGTTYYIRVFNASKAPVDYRLYTDDVTRDEFEQVAAAPAESAAVPLIVTGGANPAAALTIQEGVNAGRLAPGQIRWYTLKRAKLDGQLLEHAALTLKNVPGDGNVTNYVNFQIYTGDQYQLWARGDEGEMKNMGAGGYVERDGDHNTGEHLWSGELVNGATYYIKVSNASGAPIEYRLYTDDVINSEWGTPVEILPSPERRQPGKALASAAWERPTLASPAAKPRAIPALPDTASPLARFARGEASLLAPMTLPGSNPGSPLFLYNGANAGKLAPSECRWYTYSRANLDGKLLQRVNLTLKTVPGDGNVSNYVNFQIYTGDQRHLWARGDEDKMTNMGAGGYVERDGDRNTGERLWSGYLVNGATYYIKVSNASKVPVEYRLYTQDIIDSEWNATAHW
jgi:hypothetical protein